MKKLNAIYCLFAMATLQLAAAGHALGQGQKNIPSEIEGAVRIHQSTWDSLYSLEVEYDINAKLVANGIKQMEQHSSGNIWRTQGDTFRLMLNNIDGKGKVVDRFVDGKVEKMLVYSCGIDFTASPLRKCDDRPVRGYIGPVKLTVNQDIIPQNLRYIYMASVGFGMTLKELVDRWDIEVIKDGSISDKNKRLVLKATIPALHNERHHGTNVTLRINKEKGCLIEGATIVEYGVARKANSEEFVPVQTSWKVIDWAQLPDGTYYPSHVSFRNHGSTHGEDTGDGYFVDWIATSLSANKNQPDLGFTFPEHAIVHELLDNGDAGKLYIWGAAGESPVVFQNEAEYEAYRRKECNDAATIQNAGHPQRPLDEDRSRSWVRILIWGNIAVAAIFGILYLTSSRRS